MRILTVTPNPCIDKTLWMQKLAASGTQRVDSINEIPGGKGINVSRALRCLGRPSTILTLAGGWTGHRLKELLVQENLEALIMPIEQQTRTVTTVVETPNLNQAAFVEPGPSLAEKELQAFALRFYQMLPSFDLICFCGSMPDPAMRHFYAEAIAAAAARGRCTILDSSAEALADGLAANPRFVKPNQPELEQLVGHGVDDAVTTQHVLKQLCRRHPGTTFCLSAGGEGAYLANDSTVYHAAVPSVNVINATGSGDAFVAGLTHGLASHLSVLESFRLAAAAGTANTLSWNAAEFEQHDVTRLLKQITVKPPAAQL